MRYKRVLAPLDGSPLAECALPYASQLCKEHGSALVLLHVVHPTAWMAMPYAAETIGLAAPNLAVFAENDQALEKEAKQYVSYTVEKLRKDGVAAEGVVRIGPAAEQIVEYAVTNAIDLIVMSTHGRSGVARWYLGSVADKVLHTATVPVMLVRARE